MEVERTQAGRYYIQVASDYDPNFGSYVITAMSDDMLPALALGVGLSDELTNAWDVNYYRVDVAAGEHLFGFLDKAQQWYGYLRIRYGQLPDDQHSDASSYSSDDQAVEILETQGSRYYVQVSSYLSGFGSYTIRAATSFTNVWVSGAEPAGVGNEGPATLRIKGGTFEEGCSVWFTKADHPETIVTASTVAVIDAANIAARFNFNGAEIGSKWDLWVKNPGGQIAGHRGAVTLEAPFTDPWVSLAAPSSVRVGRASTFLSRLRQQRECGPVRRSHYSQLSKTRGRNDLDHRDCLALRRRRTSRLAAGLRGGGR